MERAKLIVKNFGPLKDIEIEVREMVALIGAQASGKSTLAKLLSILEDEDFRRDEKNTFEDELKKYNILSYLKKDTYISYDNINHFKTSPFSFDYENGSFSKGTPQRFLSFIKDANNDSSNDKNKIKNTLKTALSAALNELFITDSIIFSNIVTNEIEKNKIKSLILKKQIKSFKPDENTADELLEILEKEKSINNYIELFEKIIQNFPNLYLFDSIYIPSERSFLHLIAENSLGLLNNNVLIPKHLLNSGQEYQKAIQTIKELPLDIIDKKIKYKREGKTSYIYHNETEKVDLLESASGLQSVVPILLLVEYSKSLKEKYNFNFVVEEPELNLYPKAQHELIKYLVKNCLFDRKNLILTTHSPFVLASINNLLLAFDKGKTKPKEVNKIIKKESWLDPKNFIAYELKNGKAKKIMNDKLGQINENMIDNVSDSFSDEFDKLLDL
ncbi:AAA family ATPase [Flavobacterium limnophilum]|uniref:AAA family ATPase n=1 Tax=Flavobacterium limnophilum TaxID=3003262 RepID=UPI002482A05F|nr:AAA family ATPase [Flavobacterium limnophilum]